MIPSFNSFYLQKFTHSFTKSLTYLFNYILFSKQYSATKEKRIGATKKKEKENQ